MYMYMYMYSVLRTPVQYARGGYTAYYSRHALANSILLSCLVRRI